ncbi:MAG: adenine deaminase, partial [Candidatus Hydrothermarchaeaceae archaeon]
MKKFEGNIVDVEGGEIFPGVLEVSEGRISSIRRLGNGDGVEDYILPGFVDSHIHIESTMLTPSRFAQAVVPRGTVAVVADPHEIANVAGVEGMEFMRRDASTVPLKVYLTAPSCVPVTPFETNGASIGAEEIGALLSMDDVVALGEVMNYQGVINGDPEVLAKIASAREHGKPVDGHCPGLRGKELRRYVAAGISTDHECTTLEEAEEKARLGMRIMIREGSSAKNLEALAEFDGEGFLVSDDKHIEELLNEGHMDSTLRKAVGFGMDPLKAIRMVSLYPVRHYGLQVGLLKVGNPADFVVVNGLESFRVKEVWIDGERVAVEGVPLFPIEPIKGVNSFDFSEKRPRDFQVRAIPGLTGVRVIKAVDGEILTRTSNTMLDVKNGIVIPDIEKDVLKLAVLERYIGEGMSNAFVEGFCLKKGALASSIAHDSHNIVAVGTDEWDLTLAVKMVAMMRGGLAAVYDGRVIGAIKLPVGGIMSDEAPEAVA